MFDIFVEQGLIPEWSFHLYRCFRSELHPHATMILVSALLLTCTLADEPYRG